MNHAAADALAKRIINSWRGGPPLVDWAETLEPLDEGAAGTAFIRLRASEEHSPSIARFMALYRQLDTTRADEWRNRDYSNAISFEDYYVRLLARVSRGEHGAAEELANWDRHRSAGQTDTEARGAA